MSIDKLHWDEDALKKIENAPFFVRKLAKNKVEKAAVENGQTRITVEFVEQIRQKQSKN